MPNAPLPIQRYRGQAMQVRRPFWLPASNFYVLAVAASTGIFFLVWGVLQDGREEAPWIIAGLFASASLGAAVVMREVFLRNARNRFLADQRRLDRTIHNFYAATAHMQRPTEKFTLEKNSAVLAEIRRKSEAAKVLGKLASGHLEVIQMCDEYFAIAEREMPKIGVGSPRIAALQRGRDAVHEIHHLHTLMWAETETRALTQEAQSRAKFADRLENARQAVNVIEKALAAYPNDEHLLGSRAALSDFVVSIRVSGILEKAERADYKAQPGRALKYYQDALYYLETQGSAGPDRERMIEKITAEIARLSGNRPEIQPRKPTRKH